ncbi:MAG: hypothetical protein ABIQ49_13105 [Gemmatimonadales bacterium]
MTVAPAPDRWVVPELGPSLGRLVDPPSSVRGALRVSLDDIRLTLVTGVFELAGAGRAFAASGDPDSAVASLGRVAWLGLWEQAVAAAAARIAGEANAGLRLAGEESRFPPARLRSLALTSEDARAIGARLGSGGAGFVASLDLLAPAARQSGGVRGRAAERDRAWQEALGAVARRLESAWLALAAAALVEQDRWASEIASVRAWRRPTWPLWLLTAAVVGAATYLGLVLGGFLPAPPPLAGFAAFWWAHL